MSELKGTPFDGFGGMGGNVIDLTAPMETSIRQGWRS